MRSVSWIEFIITFGVFLFIIIYLLQQVILYRASYLQSLNNIIFFQEGSLISLLSNYNSSNVTLYNYVSNNINYDYFHIINIPAFIDLFTNNYICNQNSFCIMYNSSNEKLEFYQNAQNSYKSQIFVILYQSGSSILYNDSIGSISSYCYPIYESSYFFNRSIYYCIINMNGTAELILYPVDGLEISSYKSTLDIYYNNNEIYNPEENLFSGYYTYYSFLYKDGILYYSNILIL